MAPTPTPIPTPVPAGLVVQPIEVIAGETRQLQAQYVDIQGNSMGEAQVIWTAVDSN
jgi:hypothetical protein